VIVGDDGSRSATLKKVARSVRKYSVGADFEATWTEAWACGALCHLSATWIDCNVRVVEGESVVEQRLSALPEQSLRRNLRQVVESQQMVDKCCEATISKLAAVGDSLGVRPKWIVMAGSDYGDDGQAGENSTASNRHAKAIRDSLVRHASNAGLSLSVKVATLKNVDSDPDNLREFVDGNVDILVVKRMGVVGLDIGAIAGCTLLSTIRTGPTWSQFITRCATTIDGVDKIGHLIMPDDILNRQQFREVVEDQGGMAVVVHSVDISSTSVECEEASPQHRAVTTSELAISGYSDTMKREFSGDMEEKILWARRHMRLMLSDAEIARLISNGTISPPNESKAEAKASGYQFVDCAKDASEIRQKLEKHSATYASARADYGEQKIAWVDERKAFWVKLKLRCGINPSIQNKSIRDLSKLKRMLEVAEEINGVRL
jgi:hypothetical protein